MAGGTRATAATCTGSSEIEGLGRVGSSTTLASTQINYATLTVTAGRAMLAEASEAANNANGGENTDHQNGDENAASSAKKVFSGFGVFCWGIIIATGVFAVGVL